MNQTVILALVASVASAAPADIPIQISTTPGKQFLDNCLNGPKRWQNDPTVYAGCDGVDSSLCFMATDLGQPFETYSIGYAPVVIGRCQKIDDDVDITDNTQLVFDTANPQTFNRAKGLCFRDCLLTDALQHWVPNTRAECRMSYVVGDPNGFDGHTAMHRCQWLPKTRTEESAESLDQCVAGCTVCKEVTEPGSTSTFVCKDDRPMMYRNQCHNDQERYPWLDRSNCDLASSWDAQFGEDNWCFQSYIKDDYMEGSPVAASCSCRTVPLSTRMPANLEFKPRVEKNNRGMCRATGCPAGSCHYSWPEASDEFDVLAAWRCKN